MARDFFTSSGLMPNLIVLLSAAEAVAGPAFAVSPVFSPDFIEHPCLSY